MRKITYQYLNNLEISTFFVLFSVIRFIFGIQYIILQINVVNEIKAKYLRHPHRNTFIKRRILIKNAQA